jgi:hypothetical protein
LALKFWGELRSDIVDRHPKRLVQPRQHASCACQTRYLGQSQIPVDPNYRTSPVDGKATATMVRGPGKCARISSHSSPNWLQPLFRLPDERRLPAAGHMRSRNLPLPARVHWPRMWAA